jgi:acetate kinase
MARVLVLNTGSSTLKWSVLDAADESLVTEGDLAWDESDPTRHKPEVEAALRRLPTVAAVGHRVVHGGAAFRRSVLIDARVRAGIAALADLAPLHNPAALAGIDAALAALPDLPQVAAFDTAFHHTIPEPAARYALPADWTERWGLRRFGFHGLSVAYAVRRAAELLGTAPRRLVVCHLGAGCSVTAVQDGRSVDTSMGYTPLEGMLMARRSGSVDPGLLLHLLRAEKVGAAELDETLNQRSGLLGVSGVSADWRELERAAEAGSEPARLARAMFAHSLVRTVGEMLAVLGGLDALVFTGGIGEHSAWVREQVAVKLAFAAVELDRRRNAEVRLDSDVAVAGAPVRVLVVAAREDLTVLREVTRLVPAVSRG